MLAPDCDPGNNSNRKGKLTVCIDLTVTTMAGKFCLGGSSGGVRFVGRVLIFS